MKIKQLRELVEASSSSGPARDFSDALISLDDVDLALLTAAIKPALAKLAKVETQKRKAESGKKDAIASYVAELNKTKLDNFTFEAVIVRLKNDKAVKVAEANEIAGQFLGEPKAYRSKAEAIKAVLKRQITDKRSTDRGPRIQDIF